MKTKINLLVTIATIVTLLSGISVFALGNDLPYINKNGVELSEKEYNFVTEFYGDDYFENMTIEDYNWISDLNINDSDVKMQIAYENQNSQGFPNINNGAGTYDMVHATSYKRIAIAGSCSSICTVITDVTWLANPTIRSWDLIGARLHNTSLTNYTVYTKVDSSAGTEYSNNNKFYDNGLGTSIKLPSGASNIMLEQKFFTTLGGKVYASYQHAVRNITLSDSLNYVIDPTGYGSVFLFYNGAGSNYDRMNGVYVEL